MRLRLKFKIIDESFILSKYNSEWQENEDLNELENEHHLDSGINKTYDSFESLTEDLDITKFKNDRDHFNKIQRQLNVYDEKSKKILFPFDHKLIKFVSQLKKLLNNYLNLSYYNLQFLNELPNTDKIFTYEVQVVNLQLDKYTLCEDFYIKDLLKDNDKLE